MAAKLDDEICALKRTIVKRVRTKRGIGISNRRLARMHAYTDLQDFSISPRLLKLRVGARRAIKGFVNRFRAFLS